MNIYYMSKKLEEIFNSEKKLRKKFGDLAKAIKKRLFDLDAATCVQDMKNCPGKIEELTGNLEEHFSLRLSGNERLIFRPANEPLPRKTDGGLDW